MKILAVLTAVLVLALSDTMSMILLSEAPLMDRNGKSHAYKQMDFDKELQALNLTILRNLLVKTKLFAKLNDTSNSHTVFAPTDKAFRNVPAAVLKNITKLTEILSYHVHLGAFRTNMIEKDMKLKTLLGGQKKIRFEFYSGVIYGSCKQIGKPVDKTYDNGILDVLNGVMYPPEDNILGVLSKSQALSSLQKYVSKASDLKPLLQERKMTFLAPNDNAFSKLPADVKDKLNVDDKFLHAVLKYHCLNDIYCMAGFENGQELATFQGPNINVQVKGGKVTLNNGSTIIQNDTIAFNGVFHVIDTVLLPPSFL